MSIERGLPIMRSTQCKVGTHTYVHAGPAKEPPVGTPCDCGLEEWAGLDAPVASVARAGTEER